jgi:hypothetical protein
MNLTYCQWQLAFKKRASSRAHLKSLVGGGGAVFSELGNRRLEQNSDAQNDIHTLSSRIDSL